MRFPCYYDRDLLSMKKMSGGAIGVPEEGSMCDGLGVGGDQVMFCVGEVDVS